MSHPIFNKLDAQRKAIGITPSVLCRRAGIRKETYTRWKNSKRKPRLESVQLVCEALGLNPVTLEPLPPKPDLLEELRLWCREQGWGEGTSHMTGAERTTWQYPFVLMMVKIDELKQGGKPK